MASASRRRRRLLRGAGVSFRVAASGVAESGILAKSPASLTRRLALAKARCVAGRFAGSIILAADTIVVLGRRVLGKPSDAEGAVSMIRALRGRTHRVITGVAVLAPGQRPRLTHVETKVRMRRYSDLEIARYVKSGSPFAKAGAYAIQNSKFAPVENYKGCYCNVMGLPLWTTLRLLERAGMKKFFARKLPGVCADCPLKAK